MRKGMHLGLLFFWWLLSLTSMAATPLYDEGATFAKARNPTQMTNHWLSEANSSLKDAVKTCDIQESRCRDVLTENDMKTLIQATHQKTNQTMHDPDLMALEAQAQHARLPDREPAIGYCGSTDCVYSKAIAEPPPSLTPLQDWLALSGTTGDFNGARVLTGELSHCRDTMGSYSQCCGVARGWGQEVHIAHCTHDEKILSQRRAKGLCLLAGERCHEKVLGQCLVHQKFYCCYGSTLLREVREGVMQQLHLGFGSSHHPNCPGITIAELQRLDFTRLKLTADIKLPTVPMSGALTASLNDNEGTR